MKKKTVVSVHGGLGNQLFQMGLASKLSENSQVLLNPWKNHYRGDSLGKAWISHYKQFAEYSGKLNRIDHFFIPYTRSCFKLLNAKGRPKQGKSLRRFLFSLCVFLPRCIGIRIITTTKLGNFEIPSLLHRNYIFAYFQTEQAAGCLKEKLIAEHIELVRDEIKNEEKEILVIHVRRTDYKQNPEIGLLSSEYFRIALEELSKVYMWEELWLFSDAPTEALELIPDRFRINTRVMPSDDVSPIETLALMSCGSAYILSNSTFGWWAANLALKKPKFVVAPEPWFRSLEEPSGLIPINWIRVRA